MDWLSLSGLDVAGVNVAGSGKESEAIDSES